VVAPVFLHHDRASLDREYDNRAKVPAFPDYLERWSGRSRVLRDGGAGCREIAYGGSPAETLDLYPPVAGDIPAPVQVFFHGGYWKSLSKREFGFVAESFRPAGAATAVVDYGLIPAVTMDELVDQCRRALAWLWEHADEQGFDRERIHVSGHSAGGHLVAMLLATDWPVFRGGLPADLIKGGCGISGLYDLEPIRLCYLNEELGLDSVTVARNSPVRLIARNPAPLLLPVGELEGSEYRRQSEDLASAWGRQGLSPEVLVMTGHDHFSIVDQLGDPQSELSRAILAQMGLA
jgi:arylformamidase